MKDDDIKRLIDKGICDATRLTGFAISETFLNAAVDSTFAEVKPIISAIQKEYCQLSEDMIEMHKLCAQRDQRISTLEARLREAEERSDP